MPQARVRHRHRDLPAMRRPTRRAFHDQMQRFTGRTTAAGSGSARSVARDLPSAARLQLASTGSAANIGPLVRPIRGATVPRPAHKSSKNNKSPQNRTHRLPCRPALGPACSGHRRNSTSSMAGLASLCCSHMCTPSTRDPSVGEGSRCAAYSQERNDENVRCGRSG